MNSELFDELENFFEVVEHRYNEKALWAPLIAECGGNLYFVDIKVRSSLKGPRNWQLVSTLEVEEYLELSKGVKARIFGDLFAILHEARGHLIEAGLDFSACDGVALLVVERSGKTYEIVPD